MLFILKIIWQNLRLAQAYAIHGFLVLFGGFTVVQLILFSLENESPKWIIFSIYGTSFLFCAINFAVSRKWKTRFFQWQIKQEQLKNVFLPPISIIIMATSLSFFLFSFIDLGVQKTWDEGLLVTREMQEIIIQSVVFSVFLMGIFVVIPISVHAVLIRNTQIPRGKIELIQLLFFLGGGIFILTDGISFILQIPGAKDAFRMLAFLLVAVAPPIGWASELFIKSIAKYGGTHFLKLFPRKISKSPVFE